MTIFHSLCWARFAIAFPSLTGQSFFRAPLSLHAAPKRERSWSAHVHKYTCKHTKMGTGTTKLPLFSKPNLFLPISVWWMAFIVMPWRQIERFPRCCLAFVCAPTFALDLIKSEQTHACAVVQSDGIGKNSQGSERGTTTQTQWKRERHRARPWFQLRIFSFFLECGFFHIRNKTDRVWIPFYLPPYASFCSHVHPPWLSGLIQGASESNRRK